MLFGLIPGVILGTCIKELITLSGDDASLVSVSRLSKASWQPIPDPSYSWCHRKDPHGAGGGFQGRDQTQRAGRREKCVFSPSCSKHRAVLSHALGMQTVATTGPEPWSPVHPKPSAEQMDLIGKGFMKEEKPSGEHEVGTDRCVHPPLGSARETRVSCLICSLQTMQNCPSMGWCLLGHADTMGQQDTPNPEQVVHLDGDGQYQGQVQRSPLRRGRSPPRSPKETEGWLERTLPGLHPSTSFGIQLLHLSACVHGTPLPEEQ